MFNVNVHIGDKEKNFRVDPNKNILEFLKDNSINLPTPCGGRGTCGKCKIKVKGLLKEPTEQEMDLLGSDALNKGYRLACYNRIESDMEIFVDDLDGDANIVTSGSGEITFGRPIVLKRCIEMLNPEITDQRTDIDRVMDTSGSNVGLISLKLLKKIPELIRKKDYRVTVIEKNFSETREIIGLEAGNTEKKLYGIAVDIGTTTIAAYLYNLNNGEKLGIYSILNPQGKFGGDILTRIEYSSGSKKFRNRIHKEIIDCINIIISDLTKTNRLKNKDIYAVLFVGNTTMLHFLMDMPATNMGISPFIPVTTDLYGIKPWELKIKINENGLVVIFPSVSAYIGGDTIAAVLSTGIHKDDNMSLLIDIGTNGEIVLGNKERLYSCSTAAGPAFEGANIRNGTGGIMGAIDRVYFGDKLEYTTIGNKKAIGICGSGIVDTVAGLKRKNIIDETGRIIDNEKHSDTNYKERIIKTDGLNSFVLVKGTDSGIDDEIILTQKDVREFQNAKAAIAAGIKILLKHGGISPDKVNKIYLAGGFGNYINTENAVEIGLIPPGFKIEKIKSVGNAAGMGAVKALLSYKELKEAVNIKNKIEYIELSASREFVDEYVNCMLFP